MTTQPTDEALIASFREGNESAFNHLVLRYQERIYWLARRYAEDHETANDIVQDVFVKAYEHLPTFRGDSSFYTWVYRIAVNISLNTIRKRRVKDFFRIDETMHLEDSEELEPDRATEATETKKLIEEAIATLPEKQRLAFVMRYYEELSYEEMSKILKTSVGGLKANYFHAVRKIGLYLKQAHGTS